MSLEKSIKVINNELADTLAALAKTNNCVQKVGEALEQSKGQQAAAAASTTQCLRELNEQLLQNEVEEQAIRKNMPAADNNDGMLLQMLALKFNKLNCNLNLSRDADNATLYKFEFGPDRHITVRVEFGQLLLLQMSPEHANFSRIKQFLSETQDLIGLLSCFAGTVFDHKI